MTVSLLSGFATAPVSAAAADDQTSNARTATAASSAGPYQLAADGIVRGPTDRRQIALVFTGHEFADGASTILDVLLRRRAKASFFLTGDFLRTPAFAPLVQRMVRDGHDLGPHSDRHLLLCPWDGPKVSLVTRAAFDEDLRRNVAELTRHGVPAARITHWIPSYEWYAREHVEWSRALGLTLINFTPGTRSNADYTEEADPRFVSSQAIVDSILTKERTDPHGLNGFVLLLHVGAGPARRDKMHDRLDELLGALMSRGYTFVTARELLSR